ncbi:MAG: hypothetical protein C4545_05910 [Anaerolineaceae bacterium]|jgi:hypothetical protein|nr:MAG: hypothetical protein C4545_05910 [Anaerolineaceae bacterium]
MAVDKRTDQLMAHLESMIQILEDMDQDMQSRIDDENGCENPNKQRIIFYESQKKRLVNLHEILEDDVLTVLIGIRNLSGPIEYFEK